MGMLKKLIKGHSEQTMEVNSYCFINRDEELINLLHVNPLFELSTADLIAKGYSGKYVYKYFSNYSSDELSLKPDPKNKYDKNAVMIVLNGEFFGYVNRDDAPTILKLLKKNKITEMRLNHSGGPARRIFPNGQSTAYRFEFSTTLFISYND